MTEPSETSLLSRHWKHLFEISDYTHLTLDVFHMPNGKIKIRGRFSNGMQTVDRTISAMVFVENQDGDVFHEVINERVPMTGFGATNIRYKQQDMSFSGKVVKVWAICWIVVDESSFSIGVQVAGEGTASSGINWNFELNNMPDKIIQSAHVLHETEKVDVCAGFESNVWVNKTSLMGYWTQCDSRTGVVSEHSKGLDKPLPADGVEEK